MQREQGEDDGRAETFAEALSALKRRGSSLLVVGTAGSESFGAACDRLCGDDTDDRRRLYVRTNGEQTPSSSTVPSRTVRYATGTRSAAAADAGESRSADVVVDGGLADLQGAVDDAVRALRPHDGYEPAELRVCLDSVDALLSCHDDERVFQFVHALAGRTREARGMCHVRLPVAMDDEHVQLLAPLFDAVIEVRPGGQQRWHLHDPDLTTEWLPV
jgi:hypothetical protein